MRKKHIKTTNVQHPEVNVKKKLQTEYCKYEQKNLFQMRKMSSTSSSSQAQKQQIIQSVGCASDMTTTLDLVQTKSASNSPPTSNNQHSNHTSNTASNSPRPELTTMTNVNVLDLQMNGQSATAMIQHDRDDDDEKKETRSESYDDNDAISNW